MPARAHWNGWLKLSLVSCPISLYPAITAAQRVSFRQVNRTTGNRLRQQLVDEVTGQVVQSHDKARGYELGEREYLVVEDSELDEACREARTKPFSQPPTAPAPSIERTPSKTAPTVRPSPLQQVARREPPAAELPSPPPPLPIATPRPIENNRTIMLDRFVPRAEIDVRYYDTPYYIAPRDEVGGEAFAVIRDAMAAKGVAGLGRVVLSRRERPILIDPFEEGMCGITLRYAHEVRSAEDYFATIPNVELPRELIEVAERLIEAKMGAFDPALLEDRYRTALVQSLRAKAAIAARPRPATRCDKNVIDLMAMLKQSMVREKLTPPRGDRTDHVRGHRNERKARPAVAATERAPVKRSKPGKDP